MLEGIAVGVDCRYAGYAIVWRSENIGDSHTFLHVHTGFASTVEKYRIENCPANCEAAIAIPAKSMLRSEFAVNCGTIRGMHSQSRELRRAGFFHKGQGVHRRQYPGSLWAQVFRARLVAREMRAIEKRDIHTGFRQKKSGR
jgi:hypothetical protein